MPDPYVLPPPSAFQESTYKPQIRTEFEGNYVHVRARATRARRKFTITYNLLSEEEYEQIKQMFLDNVGGAFYIVHPVSSENVLVTFAEDTLTSEFVTPTYRRLTLILEEL